MPVTTHSNDRFSIQPTAFKTTTPIKNPLESTLPFAPLNSDNKQPYTLSVASFQGFDIQNSSQNLIYTDSPTRLFRRTNKRKEKDLRQLNQSSNNVVNEKGYKGSVRLNQQGQNGEKQVARYNDVEGNVHINQQGRSEKANEIVLGNVLGGVNLNASNATGDVSIVGTNIKGQVSINASTNQANLSKIELKELRFGATITSTGNTDIAIDKGQGSASIKAKGRQGQAEDFRVKISGLQSESINSIRIKAQKEDSAWIDLAGSTNASEVFLQGIGNTVFIAAKNNQKDSIHVDGDVALDLTQLDDNDTIITHLANGTTVSKTVTQLNELKAIKNMTPNKAVQLLKDNFSAFESLTDKDPARKDNLASFDDLVAYTNLPTTDLNLKAAAQYFIDNRAETFDKMEGLNDYGRKDGSFSLEEMTKFQQVLQGTLAMPTPKTAAEIEELKKQQQQQAIKTMTNKQAADIVIANFTAIREQSAPSSFYGGLSNTINTMSTVNMLALRIFAARTDIDPVVKAGIEKFMASEQGQRAFMGGILMGGSLTLDKLQTLASSIEVEELKKQQQDEAAKTMTNKQAVDIVLANFTAIKEQSAPSLYGYGGFGNTVNMHALKLFAAGTDIDPVVKAGIEKFMASEQGQNALMSGMLIGGLTVANLQTLASSIKN